ncbi:complement C1q tumor necrosis factor-related protein 3-like [Mya arenaria]|uniref:complement C1q tumor necrosis factor-related protein 3-like n=1 Tax=Mya arenaria TaxID=6604 RepID=UPI0022DEBB73|nr:complement C1q tumor necrosis factor-related protein 3-like [Mya arenaria]
MSKRRIMLRIFVQCCLLVFCILRHSDAGDSVQLQELSKRLSFLENSEIEHRNVNTELKTTIDQLQATVENWKTKANELESRLHHKDKRFVAAPEAPVAFHAVMDASVDHLGHNQNIVFETVLLNLGNAYHNAHGVFQAPQSGVYVFSGTIMSWIDPKPEIQAELVKNGQVLARIFGHGDSGRHDQGGVTVTTQLVTGDEVWIRELTPNDDAVYGGRFSSFTGFLLYDM